MNILGISCHYHDSGAALVCNGVITAAVQEERFTRKKHDPSFPENSIRFCLEQGKIKVSDLQAVIFYEKPILKFERLLQTYLYGAPQGISSFIKAMVSFTQDKLWIGSEIRKKLQYKGQIFYSEHHLSHAASAFYPSPFDEAVVITADGVGEWTTTSIGIGKGNSIQMLKELRFPHSLGLLYSAFTYYTGFRVNSGEYKVMGLAPYGTGKYTQKILDNLIDIKEDGSFHLNLEYFNYITGLTMTSEKFHELFEGPPRKPETLITQKEMDLAKSIQEVTEVVMERLVTYAMKETGQDKVCLAGGVALNCVANGKLLKKLPIKNMFIQPAAGDAGGALGAALYAWFSIFKNKRETDGISDSQKGSLLGPSFSKQEVHNYLEANRIPFQELGNNKFDELANLLAKGAIIGLLQGKMEFGPRALGARSIIGDARNPEMQKKMNLKIKFRESFRPFAPIILEEDFKELFDISEKSPYMLLVADILEKYRISLTDEQKKLFGIDKLNVPRSHLPAITHIDYSARLQTVSLESNPFCHNLLCAFKKITGTGVLVNTSFNVRGEPIVCTPEDAYRCFMRTEIDYLFLDPFLLKKSEQKKWEKDDSWKQEFVLD